MDGWKGRQGEREHGCGRRVALKPLQCLMVGCQLIGQKLEGDKTMKFDVLSLVNHAHAAPAKLLKDAVVRNRFTNHR